MYIVNVHSDIKKVTIKELKDVTVENYYRQIVFTKGNSYYSMKH